jgi:hypothetical protein
MRRLTVVIAICVAVSSQATAAPFDQLSSRLKQYDEQNAPSQQAPGRGPERVGQGVPTDDNGNPFVEDPMLNGPVEVDGGFGGFDGCDGGPCDSSCCPPRGFWGRAEYMMWFVRGANTPALVTTSPDNTPAGVAGVLPDATVLFGNQQINNKFSSGGRFTLGYWFGNNDEYALEDTFLFVGNSTQGFRGSSSGSPILGRPIFDEATNGSGNVIGQDALLVGFPNVVVGTVNVTSSRQIFGNEINLRRALYVDGYRRVDVLAGYRFLSLNEGLQIATDTTSIDPSGTVPVGTTFSVLDSFSTRNSFNGGQLGLSTEYFNGRWSLTVRGKVALGNVAQRVTINGSTVSTVPSSAPVTNVGGVLALPSNIGQYSRNQFGVLPEFAVDLHYQLTPLWRVNAGYTIMGLTNVVRPGDQIDTRVDGNQLPPPSGTGPFTFPTFAFHNTDLLIQGISLGLECNF